MFYSQNLLKKEGKFGIIWMAAIHFNKLNRREIEKVNVAKACEEIIDHIMVRREEGKPRKERLSLYLSSQLMYGVVKINFKHCEFLYADATDLMSRALLYRRAAIALVDIDLPQHRMQKNWMLEDPLENLGMFVGPEFGSFGCHEFLIDPYLTAEEFISVKQPESQPGTEAESTQEERSRKRKKHESRSSDILPIVEEPLPHTVPPSQLQIVDDTVPLGVPSMVVHEQDLPPLNLEELHEMMAQGPLGGIFEELLPGPAGDGVRMVQQQDQAELMTVVAEVHGRPSEIAMEEKTSKVVTAEKEPEVIISEITPAPVPGSPATAPKARPKRKQVQPEDLTLELGEVPIDALVRPPRKRRALAFADENIKISSHELQEQLTNTSDIVRPLQDDRIQVYPRWWISRNMAEVFSLPATRGIRSSGHLLPLWRRNAVTAQEEIGAYDDSYPWTIPQEPTVDPSSVEQQITEPAVELLPLERLEVPSAEKEMEVSQRPEEILAGFVSDFPRATVKDTHADFAQQLRRDSAVSSPERRRDQSDISDSRERSRLSRSHLSDSEIAIRGDSSYQADRQDSVRMQDQLRAESIGAIDYALPIDETLPTVLEEQSTNLEIEKAHPPRKRKSKDGQEISSSESKSEERSDRSTGMSTSYQLHPSPEITVERYPLKSSLVMEELEEIFSNHEKVTFRELVPPENFAKHQAAKIFYKMLVLLKKGKVKARQEDGLNFSDIYFTRMN